MLDQHCVAFNTKLSLKEIACPFEILLVKKSNRGHHYGLAFVNCKGDSEQERTRTLQYLGRFFPDYQLNIVHHSKTIERECWNMDWMWGYIYMESPPHVSKPPFN